jgi:hypothetical protein
MLWERPVTSKLKTSARKFQKVDNILTLQWNAWFQVETISPHISKNKASSKSKATKLKVLPQNFQKECWSDFQTVITDDHKLNLFVVHQVSL